MRYRRKRGSLNVGTRLDRAMAPLAMMYANTHRDRTTTPEPFTMWDFLPFEEEPPITMEQAMEAWR